MLLPAPTQEHGGLWTGLCSYASMARHCRGLLQLVWHSARCLIAQSELHPYCEQNIEYSTIKDDGCLQGILFNNYPVPRALH